MLVEKTNLKELSFQIQADTLKALGHPLRLKIVFGLYSGECNVKNLQECLNIPQATLSQHLSILKNVNIIDGERDGNQVFYKVSNPFVMKLIDLMYDEYFNQK